MRFGIPPHDQWNINPSFKYIDLEYVRFMVRKRENQWSTTVAAPTTGDGSATAVARTGGEGNILNNRLDSGSAGYQWKGRRQKREVAAVWNREAVHICCGNFPSRDSYTKNRLFHVAVTSEDTSYEHWQCRVMYYWFKKVKDMHGSDMGGFTRILHSGAPDNLMDEIPTFIVQPLPPGLDQGYIVLNRPWAFVQWLECAKIKEEYVLMAEPDHLFLKPLPNLAQGDKPAGYPFFYIDPVKKAKVVRKFYPKENGPLTNIDPIGNSPVIIKKGLLSKISPAWLNITLKMKNDNETDSKLGWVLEMYGYAVASALHGVRHILHEDFMIQPPWDLEIGESFILHYTYSLEYNHTGKLASAESWKWSFNKRSFLTTVPAKNISLPPTGAPETMVAVIKMLNEASANLPNWGNLTEPPQPSYIAVK